MALPIFEDFLYPFLVQLKDRDITSHEMREALVSHFNLTNEDCELTTRSGKNTQLSDRLKWSLQYFRRALFVELPRRGTYHLTERGKQYLQTHESLRKSDLMQYPEFVAYYRGTSTGNEEDETQESSNEEELTPTEMLENAYHSIHNDLAEDLLQKVLEQSPKFFEHLVVDLLVKMGYGGSDPSSAMVTKYVHDDGIDGVIYEDKLGFDKIYVQAKRYNPENTVGKPQVQQFAGALDEQRATKGVFITTSSYTREAKAFVDRASKKIILIDGHELARYMIEFNVGVSIKQTYEVKRIDSDYFEE